MHTEEQLSIPTETPIIAVTQYDSRHQLNAYPPFPTDAMQARRDQVVLIINTVPYRGRRGTRAARHEEGAKTPAAGSKYSSGASLAEFFCGALKIFGKHGYGKIDIPMSLAINHALVNDPGTTWSKLLNALTKPISDI